jgi:uncharacterized membrane protein
MKDAMTPFSSTPFRYSMKYTALGAGVLLLVAGVVRLVLSRTRSPWMVEFYLLLGLALLALGLAELRRFHLPTRIVLRCIALALWVCAFLVPIYKG